MKLFLTIVITIAVLVIVVRYGDLIAALYVMLFWTIVVLFLTGLVALVVWTALS